MCLCRFFFALCLVFVRLVLVVVLYSLGVWGWEFLNSGRQGFDSMASLASWLCMGVLPTLSGPIPSGMDESVGQRALYFP